jgi:hypothetical protein
MKPKLRAFKDAVAATPDIETGYRAGLQALGEHSKRIVVSDTAKLYGSVDIDTCTQTKYPNSARWDYAIAYNDEVFFVEVHSAHTKEVAEVVKKLEWLQGWLRQHAPEIEKLKAKKNPFVWIQSKNFQIPKMTPQYRLAVSKNILPKKTLILK